MDIDRIQKLLDATAEQESKLSKRQIANIISANDPSWRESVTEANRKKNEKQSKDVNWLNSAKVGGLKKRKKIQTPDGIFDSQKEAAEFYNITKGTMTWRMSRYPDQYYYIDEKSAN